MYTSILTAIHLLTNPIATIILLQLFVVLPVLSALALDVRCGAQFLLNKLIYSTLLLNAHYYCALAGAEFSFNFFKFNLILIVFLILILLNFGLLNFNFGLIIISPKILNRLTNLKCLKIKFNKLLKY